MTHDDVLFGYRLRLFDLAGRVGVSEVCRTFGVHRSTYYPMKAAGRPARAGDAASAEAAAATADACNRERLSNTTYVAATMLRRATYLVRTCATQVVWCWCPLPAWVRTSVFDPSGFGTSGDGSVLDFAAPWSRTTYVYPPDEATWL